MEDDLHNLLNTIASRYGLPTGAREELAAMLSLSTFSPTAPGAALSASSDLGRFEHLGLLGRGGIGEVYRVRDPILSRTMALKVLRPEVQADPQMAGRFIEEAQATAQLQHPGIVPIHEMGRLPDGRIYFTMKEIQGQTLAQVIRQAHQEATPADALPRLRRLIDIFLQVCQTIAYAHDRGVLHRDLKPGNIMVGEFGEVLVVDWGLAKVLGRAERTLETVRGSRDSLQTRVGQLLGTPVYMSPEQARGETDQLSPASDVYALGAVLFEILTGAPPFHGEVAEVLDAVLDGDITLTPGGLPLPDLLHILCIRAMSHSPADRPANAGKLSDEVAAWLDGARRREQALSCIVEADLLWPQLHAWRSRAAALREQAGQLSALFAEHAPIAQKRMAWSLEDEADELERRAALETITWQQHIRSALNHEPDLPEAHDRLAEHYREALQDAEATRDAAAARRAAVLLSAHDRGQHATLLQGDGRLSLRTDPPGAVAVLYRFELQDRRLEPVFVRSLGPTPLLEVPLPMGSYLIVLRYPGRRDVRYPVMIRRGQHWDGVDPSGASRPIILPASLEPGEIYIPGGWFECGGEDAILSLPRRQVWVEPVILRRDPVTNTEYLRYLNALLAAGRGEEARRVAPQELAPAHDQLGQLCYALDEGGFRLSSQPLIQLGVWKPEAPVVKVDWDSAVAYAGWLSARTGKEWRLPRELEWEKAARGVDGRIFPWGNFMDATWACIRQSHTDPPSLAPVDDHPDDISPYGVRGMAGNSRDWCADTYPPGQPGSAERMTRGGSFGRRTWWSHVAMRFPFVHTYRVSFMGFRLARSLDDGKS